jgi:hypothetical protein
MKGLGLLLGLVACARADDPVAVLMRLRDRVTAHAERIPNHTCVEAVTRDRYDYAADPAPKSCDALLARRAKAGVGTLIKLATTDRLRLDVALADTQEMYSWAGASKFEEIEIGDWIPAGAIGTGAFAATLLAIFEARDPGFAFEGEKTISGRRVLEYSFNVPEEQSHYKVKAGKEWIITGYTGTLILDAATAELVQLNVRTEQLPAATHLCEVDSSLEYGTVNLAGEQYLLPKLTRERFIEPGGAEAENTITFAACRDFRGESALHFGTSNGGADEKPPAAATPLALPSGLPVTVELTSTIQAEKAAAGDRIKGQLAEPIRDLKQQIILAPEGTAVEGRLMRVETRYGHPNEVTIALRWETLEIDGVKEPLSLTPDRFAASTKTAKPGDLRSRPMAFELPRPGEGAYYIYRFTGDYVALSSGVKSQWFTTKP